MVSWPGDDLLLLAGVFDELFGQAGGFAISDHPAGDIAAEDVKDDVQVIEAPFHRTAEFGDVPAPELIRSTWPAVPASDKADG